MLVNLGYEVAVFEHELTSQSNKRKIKKEESRYCVLAKSEQRLLRGRKAMKRMLAGIVMVMLAFSGVTRGAEEREKSATEIANTYRDTIVLIETSAIYTDGNQRVLGFGTGFFINEDGLIATNAHVVHEKGGQSPLEALFGFPKVVAYSYQITLPSKKFKCRAEMVGWNHHNDTALIRAIGVPKGSFTVAKRGDSDGVKQGEHVFLFGNPLGDLVGSISEGIVSALHRRSEVGLAVIEDYIQTTAATNPGNSGSPMINARGEVIGIINSMVRGANNIAFAVPINFLDLAMKGDVKLGWIGAEAMLDEFARSGGFGDLKELNAKTGIDHVPSLQAINDEIVGKALIFAVEGESPAMDAGLRRGDLIKVFNGRTVKNGIDLRIAIMKSEIGKPATLTILRVEKVEKKIVEIVKESGTEKRVERTIDTAEMRELTVSVVVKDKEKEQRH